MDNKKIIIEAINRYERITKHKLHLNYGITDEKVKKTVSWYNELCSLENKKICYDKKGYYINEKLSDKEIESLFSYSKSESYMRLVTNIILSDIFLQTKYKSYYIQDGYRYSSTQINNWLKKFEIEDLSSIFNYNVQKKIYLLSILGLYFDDLTDFKKTNIYLYIKKFLVENKLYSNIALSGKNIDILFDKNINYVNSLFNSKLSYIVSLHSNYMFSIFFFVSEIKSNIRYSYKSVELANLKFSIPSYISAEIFLTMLVLETNIFLDIKFIDSMEGIDECLDFFNSICFYELSTYYITPLTTEIPFYNSYIYTRTFEKFKFKYTDKMIDKISHKIISIWILNHEGTKTHIPLHSPRNYEEYKLIYNDKIKKKSIYLKKSAVNFCSSYMGNIFIEYDSLNSLYNMSTQIFFSNTKIQSYSHFEIKILNSVPKMYIIKCLYILKVNFPMCTIKLVLPNEISSLDESNVYSLYLTDSYKLMPIIGNDDNYNLKDFAEYI